MNSALLVTLLLVAGATATGVQPKFDWPISIPDIIANLPSIIAILPELIADIIENFPGIIAAIPDLIASINWPNVIANLPGNLPEIVGTIVEIVRNIVEIIQNLDIDWDKILDLLPDINIPDIIASLPDIIAQLPDLIANLPDIIASLPDIIDSLPDIIANLPDIDWPAIIELLPNIQQDPGTPTTIEQFPSIVQLEAGYGSVWAQVCAGSIVTNFHILTSCRCTYGRVFSPQIRRVRAGATMRGQGGQVFSIANAINHPTCGNGPDGDISVVRVTAPFVYGDTIQRVSISAQGVAYPIGLNTLYAGWGATAQGNIVANRQLHSTLLRLVSLEECRSLYAGGIVPRTITDNMICISSPGSGGRKADIRDAGAPVYLVGVLIGVQSFGSYINTTIPVAATAVSAYSDWIVQTAV